MKKMTVHQRLRTQRSAEHALAKWRAHRRSVRWFGGGIRCYECCDIPLSRCEQRGMSLGEQLAEEEKRQRLLALRRLTQTEIEMKLHLPEPGDPASWHWHAALGYWK